MRRSESRFFRVPRWIPGGLGALALALAGALAGAESEEPPAGPPTIVLTRAMLASGKTEGFAFEAKGGTRAALHVAVLYARNEQDHLGRAMIGFREADKIGLKLPVRVATDKDGQDRTVFSVSAAMAESCFLELHVLSRHPDKDGTDPLRIYTVELTELTEPDAPPEIEDQTRKQKRVNSKQLVSAKYRRENPNSEIPKSEGSPKSEARRERTANSVRRTGRYCQVVIPRVPPQLLCEGGSLRGISAAGRWVAGAARLNLL